MIADKVFTGWQWAWLERNNLALKQKYIVRYCPWFVLCGAIFPIPELFKKWKAILSPAVAEALQ